MAILRMSTVFAQCANDMPVEEKLKLPKVFMLLTDNPQHPSLQLQKIEGSRRTNVYECRLDRSWRIVLERTGEMTYDLIYIGRVEEAIRFGETLREGGCSYGSDDLRREVLRSYLAGSDEAMEFVAVTEGDLQQWLTPSPASPS